MKLNLNCFSKIILLLFLLFLSSEGFAQSGRGASACPDFSTTSPKKNKLVFNTFKFVKTKILNREWVIKITPYSNGGFSTSYIEKDVTAGVATTTDSSGWSSRNYDKSISRISIDFELAFKKKSSVQLSFGYEDVVYAASYKDVQVPLSTDFAGGSGGLEVVSGMFSTNYYFTGAYRYYFLYSLRRVYVSSFIRFKTGTTLYKDLSDSQNQNDFDFREKNTTVGFGGLLGYQFLVYKKFAFDFFAGPEFKYTNVFDRKFVFPDASEKEFERTHTTDKLMNVYEKSGIGIQWGVSLGYKFGKKK